MNKNQYSKGVSLIELMIITAIIGIFATLGTVGYRSMITGSDFNSNKTEFLQYLNDIRYRAFSENTHFRIQITNNANDATITVYRPLQTNFKWTDVDFIRRCAWLYNEDTSEYLEGYEDECAPSFCNFNINEVEGIALPIADDFNTEPIDRININKCDNEACTSPSGDPINICYLFDGTVAIPDIDNNILFLEIKSTSDEIASINSIYKTGYFE